MGDVTRSSRSFGGRLVQSAEVVRGRESLGHGVCLDLFQNLFFLLLFKKDLDELFLLTGLLCAVCGLNLLLCGQVLLHCVTALDISRDIKCFTLLW